MTTDIARIKSSLLWSTAYDAGNYDGAYSPHYRAHESARSHGHEFSLIYRDAYALGFYSTYEIEEIQPGRKALIFKLRAMYSEEG